MDPNNTHQQDKFIARLRQGDASSYETLVRDYGGQMLALARRYTRNEADASECVQEAFLQVFRNIHTFEARSSLRSWLNRIVINTSLMKLRANKRRPEESLDEYLPDFDSDGQRRGQESLATQSVEALLTIEDTRAEVRAAIDKLPETSRNLLLLRDIQEYSTKEVASFMNMTPGAVKTGLHRARGALKLLLKPMMHEDKA